MPELPEVQTTVDGIKKYAVGKTIVDVWTNYKNLSGFHDGKDNIKNADFFSSFKKKVVGKKILNTERRAKNILIGLSGDLTILIHMKMTGHVLFGEYTKKRLGVKGEVLKEENWEPKNKNSNLGDSFNQFIRVVFSLSDGKHLVLSDMRRFAKVTLIENKDFTTSLHLKHLGLEPLSKNFDADIFKKTLLKRENYKIKRALLDQTLVVGIGNIYSDEALWRAGIHPERLVKDISKPEWQKLFKESLAVLKKGIDFGGDSMSDYRNILGEKGKFQEEHNAYRRTGLPCKKKGCGGKIVRKIITTRSSHFCDTHQKESKS